jgi:hypothetical protein
MRRRLALASALAAALPCLIWIAPAAANSGCVSNRLGGPVGKLVPIARYAGGSTGGRWYADELRVQWFVKADVHFPELQTSAEVISSEIYSFFGYHVPETFKLKQDGVPVSVSKDIGGDAQSTDFSGLDRQEVRQLRVVAAYLKDWDRLGNAANNRLAKDGALTLLDFGGALGARARGEHKPGRVFSKAVGAFEATDDLSIIFDQFIVHADRTHPWNRITRDDVLSVVERFKLLTDEKIEEIVKRAQYSRKEDEDYMISALKKRRDGISVSLPERFKEP